MGALRYFTRDHRRLVVVLTAMALAMRVLVPAGYMVAEQSRVLTVSICTDASNAGHVKQMTISVNGKPSGSSDERSKSDGPCPYSALSMASPGGVDAPLLVLALAFILAASFAPSHFPSISKIRRDRPPLRGPPSLA